MLDKTRVPLSRPYLGKEEIEAVAEVLRTPFLSLGPRFREFEAMFSEYMGGHKAIAVSSGTAGLHLAVRAVGVREGDLVITTPFSFISSSNVILYERGVPLFFDIDVRTLNLDPERVRDYLKKKTRRDKEGNVIDIERGKRIAAMILVHIFGHPVDMDPFIEMSREYDIPIIEDACEALGALYKGKKAGTFGEISVFAFYPNKQITTGEGGMVTTARDDYAELIRSMRNQGRGDNGRWLNHVRLGYNYRMDELSAALGIAQMRKLDFILKKRDEIARLYTELLSEVEGVEAPFVAPWARMSWFVYVVRLSGGIDRERVMKKLKEAGIDSRPYFPPIHLQPFYRETFGFKEGDFPVTESISKRTVALPFYTGLEPEKVRYVVDELKKAIKKEGSF